MKALHDLSLPAPLRAAIQAVRHRLTQGCSVERLGIGKITTIR